MIHRCTIKSLTNILFCLQFFTNGFEASSFYHFFKSVLLPVTTAIFSHSVNLFSFLIPHFFPPPLFLSLQIFPGLILSDIKPAKRMKFKTVCYLLVQLMHCRKMFKAEIPFSNVMTCDDDDKVRDYCSSHRLRFFSVEDIKHVWYFETILEHIVFICHVSPSNEA